MERRVYELTALLALLGIASSGAVVNAADVAKGISKSGPMFIAEKKTGTSKGGANACGKGACGTDKKGAAAAKKKHAAAAKTHQATDAKSTTDNKASK
jgi:hypothetical protein